MTCPVPRERSDSRPSLDRTERILRWLGFKPCYRFGNMRSKAWSRESELINLSAHISPELDYLVLEKVRTLDGNKRGEFAERLERVWLERNAAKFMSLEYLPGDHAEAARFLWEGE